MAKVLLLNGSPRAKGWTGRALEEMIRVSDKRMYEDKSQYYQAHDRRRRR